MTIRPYVVDVQTEPFLSSFHVERLHVRAYSARDAVYQVRLSLRGRSHRPRVVGVRPDEHAAVVEKLNRELTGFGK